MTKIVMVKFYQRGKCILRISASFGRVLFILFNIHTDGGSLRSSSRETEDLEVVCEDIIHWTHQSCVLQVFMLDSIEPLGTKKIRNVDPKKICKEVRKALPVENHLQTYTEFPDSQRWNHLQDLYIQTHQRWQRLQRLSVCPLSSCSQTKTRDNNSSIHSIRNRRIVKKLDHWIRLYKKNISLFI